MGTNFWFKDSTPESTELYTSSNATTDVTTNATSEATATVCQECTTEDHVSVCHVPQAPNSDFAVSKMGTLTGTIVVTEASRPVPKNKSMEVTSTTNPTSTKSTRNTTLTTKDLSSLTTTGTDKSTNGALRLLLVLKNHPLQTPKILQKPNSSSNRSIPCSSQRTSQGLGWSSKRQIVRSSRSYLPKNQEPHCSMEIVLRTNGLQGQS